MTKELDLTDYGVSMWDDKTIANFRRTLLTWYDQNKRDLPWRRTKNPYAIWVSEIMLQQTQVITVIPYYERFLTWFPTVADLAQAPQDQLLKAWEGLGYYSRVRNMQAAAQQIMADYGGHFPTNYADIASLKGIGPYTAGAIASIAFDLPEPAVDGNVMRVMARLFEVNHDIGNPNSRKIFQAICQKLIDPDRPGDFNQALMDLGTDIDSAKNPRPQENPVRFFSGAYLNGTYDRYPIKLPKKKPKILNWQAFVLVNDKGQFLLEQNQASGLLSGFWSFPLLEASYVQQQTNLFEEIVLEEINQTPSFEETYQIRPAWSNQTFAQVSHTFSHQKWQIKLLSGQVKTAQLLPTDRKLAWVHPDDFDSYPMAAPQKKMWAAYQQTNRG